MNYGILHIFHGGKLSQIQNQIHFTGNIHSLTVRSSLVVSDELNPKIYRHCQATVKHARA